MTILWTQGYEVPGHIDLHYKGQSHDLYSYTVVWNSSASNPEAQYLVSATSPLADNPVDWMANGSNTTLSLLQDISYNVTISSCPYWNQSSHFFIGIEAWHGNLMNPIAKMLTDSSYNHWPTHGWHN